MRHLFAFSVILLCFSASAQITITSANMPVVGDTFHAFRDNAPANFSVGPKGANVTWNFSSLVPDDQIPTYAVSPASTPYAADFPNANLVLTTDHVAYLFYQNKATAPSALKAEGLGSVDANLGTLSINNSPVPDWYRFPMTYPGNYAGSTGWQESKPYDQLPPNIQQAIDSLAPAGVTITAVRITNSTTYKDTIDAWGTVVTPLGSYSALRRKRVEASTNVLAVQVFGFFWQSVDTTTNNTSVHSWLTTINKMPLIALTYNNAGAVVAASYSSIPPPPVAAFTWDNPSGGTVNFTNTSQNSPATYSWDFGDGNTSTQASPSHVYANGSFNACLRVANESGRDTFCANISIVVTQPPVAEFTWDNSGGGTVDFTNTSQNNPTTFEWDFGDGGSSSLENPVHIYAANSVYNTCLKVSNSSGADSVCQQVTVTKIASSASVSGSVNTETGKSVRSVKFTVTGTSDQVMTTGTSGNYSFTFNSGESPVITPSKNNDTVANNGISTLDLILIQKQVLVSQPLPLNTPYKLIAADVNNTGSVSTLDIVLIRSVVLAVNPTFPGNRLWAFVPDDYVFPNPLNPFPYPANRSYTNLTSDLTGEDFIGMKLGDVNNNWDSTTAKTASVGEVQFVMDEKNVLPEQEITLPVKVKDFNNISGYQFTVSWNPEVLALEDVTNKSLNGYFGKQKISEGKLTTSWNDENGRDVSLSDDEVAFELKFKAIGENGTSSVIKINSVLTAAEAYNGNLDLLEITPTNGMVKVGDVSSIVHSPSSLINLQVQPNPFTNSTQIIFEIPKDETVSITIYDILGKAVKQLTGNYSAGKHTITWSGDDGSGNLLLPDYIMPGCVPEILKPG